MKKKVIKSVALLLEVNISLVFVIIIFLIFLAFCCLDSDNWALL